TLRSILISSVWIILGAGLVVLLVAAISKKNTEILAGVEIHIQGVQNLYFVNKQDVLHIMEKVNGKKLDKEVVSTLDLVSMENELLKDQWISEVKIFFDNNNVLQVRIMEREPVARIFTVSGESYYLDNDLMRLPLSEKFSARLPVFTNFPANGKVWSRSDSIMGNEIKLL